MVAHRAAMHVQKGARRLCRLALGFVLCVNLGYSKLVEGNGNGIALTVLQDGEDKVQVKRAYGEMVYYKRIVTKLSKEKLRNSYNTQKNFL